MEFEQIAMHDNADFDLMKIFIGMGHPAWTKDVVVAEGVVASHHGGFVVCQNTAILQFNYTAFPGKELEMIHYTDGPNFLNHKLNGSLSHLGWHVESIESKREYMEKRGFRLKQEVITKSHESPLITRRYHYAIYVHPVTNYAWKLIERIERSDAELELIRLLEMH